MKTWYQVEQFEPVRKVFGFSVRDGTIIDHPNLEWVGMPTPSFRIWCRANKVQVYKIADQHEPT